LTYYLGTCLSVLLVSTTSLTIGTVLLHTEHLGFLALTEGPTNQFAIQTSILCFVLVIVDFPLRPSHSDLKR